MATASVPMVVPAPGWLGNLKMPSRTSAGSTKQSLIHGMYSSTVIAGWARILHSLVIAAAVTCATSVIVPVTVTLPVTDWSPVRALPPARLALVARPVAPGELNAAQAAEESCRIVGTPGYYPGRKVDTAYIEQFTPVMEARLALAGARLAAALNRVLR